MVHLRVFSQTLHMSNSQGFIVPKQKSYSAQYERQFENVWDISTQGISVINVQKIMLRVITSW